MADEKIHVIAKDGMALVGSAFHVLTGKCLTTLKTDSIESFREYLKSVGKGVERVYFDDKQITAMPAILCTDYEVKPIAVCAPSESPELASIRAAHRKRMSMDEMEKFLRTHREAIDNPGKILLDFCTNGTIKKITEIKKSKDNRGNFVFNVKRESGQDDFVCPQSISFETSILKNVSDKLGSRPLSFDMFLDIDGASDVRLYFQNLNFDKIVDFFKKEIILGELSTISVPKFWGSLEVSSFTDSWKYENHGL